MSDINIVNQTKQRIPRQLVLATLSTLVEYFKIKTAELSVVFITPLRIKKLNQTYRHQNHSTDVLSFCYEYNPKKKKLVGEIIICSSIASSQALEYGHSFNQEIRKLLTHSFLHLLGYDHKKAKDAEKMEKLEKKIVEEKLYEVPK